MDGSEIDADAAKLPFIHGRYIIMLPDNAQNVSASIDEPQCASVCPVWLLLMFLNFREAKEDLTAKKREDAR